MSGRTIVTAGNLVIIGATIYDHEFHAYDSKTGKLLWEYELPYAGNATPATYMIDGKQYISLMGGTGKVTPSVGLPPAPPSTTPPGLPRLLTFVLDGASLPAQ